MKKHLLLLCVLLVSVLTLDAQTEETALRDAKIAAKATLEMDFKTVLKHTYPSIVEMMGGEEKAIPLLEQTFESMKSNGFKFEKAEVLSVSNIVEEQGQHRCYIEGENVMVMNDQRITSKSYLLGIYDSEKELWYFLEAQKLKDSALANQVLPNFKTSLNIPDDEMKTESIKY